MNHTGTDENKYMKLVALMSTSADGVMTGAVNMAVLTSLDGVQIEGEPDLIVELIDLYLDDAPHKMVVMQEAIRKRDVISLKRAAHNLKGSSDSLGARQLAILCEQLELLEGNSSFQRADTLLAGLEQEFERVQQVFTAERQRRS